MTIQQRNKMVEDNLGLVSHIASKDRIIQNFIQKNYVDFMDMFQIGVIGLIDAVEKYDFNKGNQFSTYAYIKIRGKMLDWIKKDTQFRAWKDKYDQGLDSIKVSLDSKISNNSINPDTFADVLDNDIPCIIDSICEEEQKSENVKKFKRKADKIKELLDDREWQLIMGSLGKDYVYEDLSFLCNSSIARVSQLINGAKKKIKQQYKTMEEI
jgi:RNA polymerase sigma factor for flagellar operon FliA